MVKELELSVMEISAEQVADLQRLLEAFKAQTSIQVNLQTLDWDAGRAELVKAALYHHGADVSEVGATWLGDLISMNALRPFSAKELEALGGGAAFVPAAWQGGQVLGDPHTWSIPWVVSPMLIHYRCAALEQAKINPQTAFESLAQLEQTLQRLQSAGMAKPLTLPVRGAREASLHTLATWVWEQGGDFLAPDGKRVIFDQPEALKGLHTYFGLHRYLSGLQPGAPANEARTRRSYMTPFWEGRTAAAVGDAWLATPDSPQAEADLGVARLPGTAFVSSQHLVVWQHSRDPEAAVELVRFLTKADHLETYASAARALPARLETLARGRFEADPMHRMQAEAAGSGRAFPCIPLLGLMEEKLGQTVEYIWLELLRDPNANLRALVNHNLQPLARRLNMTFRN
jgi:ABC-type glycerol-3-phosphate transport system substrate-binding protein